MGATHTKTMGMFTPNKFKKGSIVLITGASSGLGREIAYVYAQRGCPVVINARNKQSLDEVVETCKSRYNNNNVVAFAGDVTD
jgi:NAD(P)-dependent dehydrogenase (short-subunit alcohol dehydrogenase family)